VANGPGFADTEENVLIPVILLFLATTSAAVMAYGTHANLAQYPHGFEFILIARRLQWPLAVLSLGLCLALLGMVIAGRKRAWWLIGLGPVLALFVHRFAADPSNQFLVTESPTYVSAAEANFVADADWVVGLRVGDTEYAYPYGALFGSPVVIHTEHDKRVALLWSAYANRALAIQVGRELRASDLDVVSTPANALLLYNSRLGQFINALTGHTPEGGKPDGFRDVVATSKTTWKQWRTRHPDTKVFVPIGPDYASAPRTPIQATFPLPPEARSLPEMQVALIATKVPIAVKNDAITTGPLNTVADDTPLLVFRDGADGSVRVFDRRIDDLRPQFRLNTDPKRPKAIFVDADTGAGWNAAGVVVDGPPEMKGKRLAPIPAEDALDWRVLKSGYPSLQLAPSSDKSMKH
jgi:hypothetical protein